MCMYIYVCVCVCVYIYIYIYIYVCMLSLFSCVQLFCDAMDCSPPGSSVHGILQARILEWVAMPSSRGSSRPRDPTHISCIPGRFLTTSTTWETLLITSVLYYFLRKSELLSKEVHQSWTTLIVSQYLCLGR